jgi:hypothetical protein
MQTFAVTYEIITHESAADGEAEESGYISEDASLRNAIADLTATRTSHVDGVNSIECDEYPVRAPRRVSVCNGMEYLTGAYEMRTIHFPNSLTPATRRRIAKLLGAYGTR